MALFRDVKVEGQVVLDLPTDHKLRVSDTVTIKLLYKRGNNYARLAISAPDEVRIKVLPPDGEKF